jgi:hypothetical protein
MIEEKIARLELSLGLLCSRYLPTFAKVLAAAHAMGKQRAVLASSLAAFVMCGLFPPWLYTNHGRYERSEKSAGYHLIFTPPQPMSLGWASGVRMNMQVLLIEWACVAAGGAAVFLVAGSATRVGPPMPSPPTPVNPRIPENPCGQNEVVMQTESREDEARSGQAASQAERELLLKIAGGISLLAGIAAVMTGLVGLGSGSYPLVVLAGVGLLGSAGVVGACYKAGVWRE